MRRLAVVLALIILQIVGALSIGYFVVNMNYRETVAAGVLFEDIDLAGMNADSAADAIISRLSEALSKERAKFRYVDDEEYAFYLSEIEPEVDRDLLVLDIEEKSEYIKGLNLISLNLLEYTVNLEAPRITFDDIAFRAMLDMIKPHIERNPSNANIEVVGDEIVITPDVSGIVFDIDKSFQGIKERFRANPFEINYLSSRRGRELEIQPARITTDILIDMESVIADASTPILPGVDIELMQKAADSINKVFLHGIEFDGNEGIADRFSLNKYLTRKNLLSDTPVEEYNQLASTLYMAVLKAGINCDKKYLNHQDKKVDYCNQGFNIIVLGSNRDFMFENNLNSDIIIFAYVDSDAGILTVKIAGKFDESNPHTHVVNANVTETIEPQTRYVESADIPPGTEQVIEEGVAGYTVVVYRDGEEIDQVRYNPRPRIVSRSNGQ